MVNEHNYNNVIVLFFLYELLPLRLRVFIFLTLPANPHLQGLQGASFIDFDCNYIFLGAFFAKFSPFTIVVDSCGLGLYFRYAVNVCQFPIFLGIR